MRKKIFLLTTLIPISLFASENTSQSFILDGLSSNIAIGYLHGKAQELVYDDDYKMSQLDWKTNNAVILKGDIQYDIIPRLSVGVRGWTTLAKGNAFLTDADWEDRSQTDPTSLTHHNSNLNYANEVDLNLSIWLLRNENYKAGLTAGYQQTAFSWSGKGREYVDDDNNPAGYEPNEKVIGYKQKFRSPYIGLAGSYAINNFEFSSLFKFSNWAKAKDHDEHYPNQTFKTKVNKLKYYSFNLNAGYYITPKSKLFTEFTYNHYLTGKGETELWNRENETYQKSDGNAGRLNNHSYIVSIGYQYTF